MRFLVERTSELDLEGIDDRAEAERVMGALSENTVGMTMSYQATLVTYVRHVKTIAFGPLPEPSGQVERLLNELGLVGTDVTVLGVQRRLHTDFSTAQRLLELRDLLHGR